MTIGVVGINLRTGKTMTFEKSGLLYVPTNEDDEWDEETGEISRTPCGECEGCRMMAGKAGVN